MKNPEFSSQQKCKIGKNMAEVNPINYGRIWNKGSNRFLEQKDPWFESSHRHILDHLSVF